MAQRHFVLGRDRHQSVPHRSIVFVLGLIDRDVNYARLRVRDLNHWIQKLGRCRRFIQLIARKHDRRRVQIDLVECFFFPVDVFFSLLIALLTQIVRVARRAGDVIGMRACV